MVDIFGMDTHTLLHTYGYYAILIWTFLEGETVVIIAGILAQQGYLNPVFIALCAFAGSCTSDQLMFMLGKYIGRGVLARFPRLQRNAGKAEKLIRKHETLLILGFRFVYGVRNVTPILLGINRVSHLKFLLLNIIGAGVWACTFTASGFFLGKLFNNVPAIMGTAQHLLLYALLLAALIGAGIWYLRQRRRAGEHARIVAETRQKEES